MSASYFDRLEAELRAAVPRASERTVAHRRWRRPRLGSGVAVAAGIAVTVAVLLALIGPLHSRHEVVSRPGLHHERVGPGVFEYPLGSAPTFRQLMDNFAALRRPQTAADRTWQPSDRHVAGLTRLVTKLPSGYRVYLDVEQVSGAGLPAAPYVLNVTVVDPHGPTSGAGFGPNTNFTVFPISSGGNDAVWASIVPDGVATVQWTFGCPGGPRTPAACVSLRSFTLPVVDNVAARQIANAGNCDTCASPLRVSWLSADGRTVATFNRSFSLAAPPFVKDGRGDRVLRVLGPRAVGNASLHEPWSSATRAIRALLGAPAQADVPVSSCGIDHESVWTSPSAAQPLTVYERSGRLVGYSYGPAGDPLGLLPGPGARLGTARGLFLADAVAIARRLYRTGFTTSAAGHGTWRAGLDGGTMHGSLLPSIYPIRPARGSNLIATIAAGNTGCPVRGSR